MKVSGRCREGVPNDPFFTFRPDPRKGVNTQNRTHPVRNQTTG